MNSSPKKSLARKSTSKRSQRKASPYPIPQEISYIAEVNGTRTFFLTDDDYSRNWFYPRYENGKLHEPAVSRMLMKSLTPSSVFVDVGAHLGYFSMIAAQTASAVFAIEPQEFLIGRIHRNICANHYDNVHILYAAAGNEPGFVRMPKIGHAGAKVGGDEGSLVPMVRLDDYFNGERTPTHLKIDTEGFEYQVLEGATKILETRPVLYIELHDTMDQFGHTIDELHELIKGYGYQIRIGKHRKGDTLDEKTLDEIRVMTGGMICCEPLSK